ncbi:DUF6155 family protein [Lentibacillus sp. N15]|uniref:DUF6155 family protein n=1 Tax=Lentibacillus songyuanensis TaxID=3136161 RepID=UPI0031B9AC7D
MMRKINHMKVPELKKNLKAFDQKELVSVITDLYKLNSDVKDYLTMKFTGEATTMELFERAKKDVRDEFFPDKGFGKTRLAQAKKAITNFKKLTNDSLRILDLMLYYVEVGTEFTNTYGDIDETFYYSMESMYMKVIAACEKDETVFKQFNDRLYAIVEDTDGMGWGFHDNLEDIYYSIGWLDK